MKAKIIGCVLLIVGTSIGAGMLALPVVTAAGGFLNSLLLFLGAWIVTVIGAYFILEVNLWLPENTNLISMARATLGPLGQVITWLVYLMLLYSLLAAYTAGGSDLLRGIFQLAHWQTQQWVSALLFVIILGFIVLNGVRVVDITNRGLMSLKMGAYVLLVALLFPYVHLGWLAQGHIKLLAGAIMVVITSFGYATVIPSLRYYFNSDVKALRLIIALGSGLSLIIYVLWDFAVQSTVPSQGAGGLIDMAASGKAASELTLALSKVAASSAISNLAHLFASICITTSFLGVALCLTDFLKDGLQVQKKRWGKWLAAFIAYIPPVLIVIFHPEVFILGLTYAGVFCVILLMLLPALMVFSGRYVKKIATGFQLWGGKSLVVAEIVVALILLGYSVFLLAN